MTAEARPRGATIVAVEATEEARERLGAALGPLEVALHLFAAAAPALAAAERLAPDLVLVGDALDADGPDLLRRMRVVAPECPLLALAGPGDPDRVWEICLAAGASDVVMRPLRAAELRARVATGVALALSRRREAAHARELAEALARAGVEKAVSEREIIRRLMLAAEHRDDQANGHLARVAGCVIAIAEGLGLSETAANDVALASTMHDIGKIGVSDTVLLKDGPLTPVERRSMMEHAVRGFDILAGSPSRLLHMAAEIALTHHERWDGAGYPQGLKGPEIPLAGRITAVADVFDALISARPYKAAWTLERARAHVEAQSGLHFDPDCVRAFLARWADIVELVGERGAALAFPGGVRPATPPDLARAAHG